MSDTPRTDRLLTDILDAYGYVHQGNCPQRWVNHARELERELNAANDRIKRLEEAGDEMVAHAKALGMEGTGLVKRWKKAKEDKP